MRELSCANLPGQSVVGVVHIYKDARIPQLLLHFRSILFLWRCEDNAQRDFGNDVQMVRRPVR